MVEVLVLLAQRGAYGAIEFLELITGWVSSKGGG
jgi:hypothetical protein